MSFSSDVKEELVNILPKENHCCYAELSALLSLFAKIEEKEKIRIFFSDDNDYAFRKCFTLLNKTFNIKAKVLADGSENGKTVIEIAESEAALKTIIEKLCLENPKKLLDRDCCKRAYLRGAFLATGFAGDPNKGYHFEILSDNENSKETLASLMESFGISPKQSTRKKYKVLYIKGVDAISDMLNVLGAHKSLMELANARIVRDLRNTVNRRQNCDMANLNKTVDAASRQIEDILFIDKSVGLDSLPDSLREIAEKRVENPDVSLSELGTLLNPPVGKSGVNHRLRKLGEYADSLR